MRRPTSCSYLSWDLLSDSGEMQFAFAVVCHCCLNTDILYINGDTCACYNARKTGTIGSILGPVKFWTPGRCQQKRTGTIGWEWCKRLWIQCQSCLVSRRGRDQRYCCKRGEYTWCVHRPHTCNFIAHNKCGPPDLPGLVMMYPVRSMAF